MYSLLDIQNLLLFPRNSFHVSHQGVLGVPEIGRGSQEVPGIPGVPWVTGVPEVTGVLRIPGVPEVPGVLQVLAFRDWVLLFHLANVALWSVNYYL